MSKQVTLTLKSLTGLVTELETIKGQVTAHAGTQAEKLKKARAEALPNVKVPVLQVKASDSIDVAEAAIADWQSTLTQRIDEAVAAIMRAGKDDTDKGLTALRESFAAKRETAEALKSVMVSMNIEGVSDVVIPSLKGTGRIGTGSTSKGGTKGQSFYRLIDGEKKVQPDSQNKFSSVAFYFGRAIGVSETDCTSNKGKGCGASALESFLKGKGVDVTAGKPWVYEVSPGFSVGMDVTATEEAPAE